MRPVYTGYEIPDYSDTGWLDSLDISKKFIKCVDSLPEWCGYMSFFSNIFDWEGDDRLGINRKVESLSELVALLMYDVTDTKEGLLVAGGRFYERRTNKEFIGSSLFMLDIDEGPGGEPAEMFEQVCIAFRGYTVLAYSSYNDGVAKYKDDGSVHKPEGPRYRVILPLAREINGDEFPLMFRWIATRLAKFGVIPDESTKNASRIMFTPRVNPNAPGDPWLAIYPGENLLDPDKLPGKVSIKKLARAEKKKCEEARKKTLKNLAKARESLKSDSYRIPQRARALGIVRSKINQLAEGGAMTKNGRIGRNASVFFIAAEIVRLEPYLSGDDQEALRDECFEAALGSGLSDDDLERQFDNGTKQGHEDGPRVLSEPEAIKTSSFNHYSSKCRSMFSPVAFRRSNKS